MFHLVRPRGNVVFPFGGYDSGQRGPQATAAMRDKPAVCVKYHRLDFLVRCRWGQIDGQWPLDTANLLGDTT